MRKRILIGDLSIFIFSKQRLQLFRGVMIPVLDLDSESDFQLLGESRSGFNQKMCYDSSPESVSGLSFSEITHQN